MPLLFGLTLTEVLELLTAIMTALGPLARLTGVPLQANKRFPLTEGQRLLAVFGFIVMAFAAVTAWVYRRQIIANSDLWFFGVGLFLVMVLGMFAQVLVANHQNGSGLFDVEVQQLALPLLFSVVVYYSIWAVAFGSGNFKVSFFPFYTAFLNGYFWRNVMAGAKPPTAPAGTPASD